MNIAQRYNLTIVMLKVKRLRAEKNGKEAPIWGVAQFGEMSHPARRDRSGADSVTSFWCRVWFGNIA